MSTSPAVRESDRDLTTGRHPALGSLLGRVWAVDQIRKERTGRYSGRDYFTID